MEPLYKKVIATWGDAGEQWLASLPTLIKELSEEWELYKLKPHAHLSYNYVSTGYSRAYTDKVILKISFDKQALEREAAALKFYDGNGCVRLLEYEENKGALLLEDAIPGIMLKTLFPHEDEACIIRITQVMKHLHAKPLERHELFPTLQDWLKALNTPTSDPDLEEHRLKALPLSKHLLATQTKTVLLHGDLHHENLLSSHRHGWLAIDPKGVIGEPIYEVGAFIRNPINQLVKEENPKAIIKHRIELFAKMLGADQQRIKDWSYVQAVLAACWTIEDNQNPKQMLTVADWLATLE